MGTTNFSNNNNANNGNIPPGGLGGLFVGAHPNTDPFQADEILTNMNKKAVNAAPVKFREKVIKQLTSVLIAKYKPNAILIGMAGTGKTAIVEELARMIENKDPSLPPALVGKTIYSLEFHDITAGAGIVGALEEKVKDLLDFLKDPSNKAILFLDEIHQLLSRNHDARKISQILKPALSRGEIHVIGATTTQEAAALDKDPAFNRRFTKILVDELSKQQTEEILKTVYPELIKHYNQTFPLTPEMTNLIVNTADEFCFAGSHKPDNAITLFDRSVSDALIDKIALMNNPDPAIAQAAKSIPGIVLTEKGIRQTALKMVTGNNTPKEFEEQKFKDAFARIKGQDAVLNPILRELKRHMAHYRPQKKPFTMLFMGPSGCGKTEVAKIIAKTYLEQKPIILNMTEYAKPDAINKIIGSSYGYIGSEDDNEKPFDILETNPYQIILLDEFEKCHSSVRKLFMSVFDEGTLKTNKGKTIDFSKTIIIVTTNAGCTNDQSEPLGFLSGTPKDPTDDQIIKTLSNYFELELLNRFTRRYRFRTIEKGTFREILKDSYKKQSAEVFELKPRAPLPAELPDNDADDIADRYYNRKFNARPAEEAIAEYIDRIMIP